MTGEHYLLLLVVVDKMKQKESLAGDRGKGRGGGAHTTVATTRSIGWIARYIENCPFYGDVDFIAINP